MKAATTIMHNSSLGKEHLGMEVLFKDTVLLAVDGKPPSQLQLLYWAEHNPLNDPYWWSRNFPLG